MSLINQVLRDLDARKAADDRMLGLPDRVRPLPAKTSLPWQPWALAIGGVLIGAAGAYLALGLREAAPPPPAAPAASAAPVAHVSPAAPDAAAVPTARNVDAGTVKPLPVADAAPPVDQPIPIRPIVVAPAVAKTAPDKAMPSPRDAGGRDAARGKAMPAASAGAGVAPGVATAPPIHESPLKADRKVAIDLPVADAPTASARASAAAAKAVELSAEPGRVDKRARAGGGSDEVEAEYRKSLSAFRRGAVAEAQTGLKHVLQSEPRHSQARQALLSLLVEQQHWQEAMALAEDGLALDPAQTGWAMALARLQLEHGNATGATETLAKYARHATQNPDYIAFHALLLQKQFRAREAAERYGAALALRPGEARWWYGLGTALEADHRPQEARDAFVRAKEAGNLPPELAASVEQRLR